MDLTINNLYTYDDLKLQMKPFDLIAFRGSDTISNLISMVEKLKDHDGTFTHCAMVVDSTILPYYHYDNQQFILEPDTIYLLESTFSFNIPGIMIGVNDVIDKKGEFGVQLRLAAEVIPNYISNNVTRVAYCKLINNPYNNETKDLLKEQFMSFFTSYHGRFYDLDALGLLGAIFPLLRFLRDERDYIITTLWKKYINDNVPIAGWQFCSELVANVYQLINIIPPEISTKNILPIDFFGDDEIKSLVEYPKYIKDWSIPNKPSYDYVL